MSKVTNEQVEAALATMNLTRISSRKVGKDEMRAALEAASSLNPEAPVAWKQHVDGIFDEMDRRMSQPKHIHQEPNPKWLPVDDTQVGIEFALEYLRPFYAHPAPLPKDGAVKALEITNDAPKRHWFSAADVEQIVDAVMEVARYAPKIIPMGANPPLFDGMQSDNDGPWVSRVAVAKRLRAALDEAKPSNAGALPDQVILELRAAQHVLGYPDALGDAIEAISGVEEERVRLWNEVRDLKSSLNVEKAATDTMRTERDELLIELKAVQQQCLFDDDDGGIGVSEDVTIPSDMFDRMCTAIAKAEGRSS